MGEDGVSTLIAAARRTLPGNRPRQLLMQAQMVSSGLRNRPLTRKLLAPAAGTALAEVMRQRPEMIGALVWPYVSASFDAGERLRRITAHYAAIDRLGPPFRFACDERLVLLDLGDILPGLKVVLDQPIWFLREGGLVVNLFIDSFRAFSVAFSLQDAGEAGLTAWIGGIQGRNRDDMLETYRTLTKLMHGLRPRDALLEILKLLLRHWNATALYGVSDAARHHRHPYFRGAKQSTQNYDEIWLDRGGVAVDGAFFQLPLAAERRDLATVKPNKRSMYRQRFDLLDDIEARLISGLKDLTPVRFADS